jgi:hypothetical protein
VPYETAVKSLCHRYYIKDIITAVLIFLFALGLRNLYQEESVVDHPIRADAAKYVKAAYNLRFFGVYSLETPNIDGRPPNSGTDLSPGYPIFLSLFLGKRGINPHFLLVQGIMGALVCVLTFALARMALPYPWALMAGILTALCPHLIAMDGYCLTESLFTFVMMIGLLLLAVGWEQESSYLVLSAGLILTLSSHIRALNMLLVFWMAPVFLWHADKRIFAPRSVWIRHMAFLITGFVIVTISYRLFVNETKPSGMQIHIEAQKKGDFEYVDVIKTLKNLPEAWVPPAFYEKGESHILVDNGRNNSYKLPTKSTFWQNPVVYLKWNLWGRLFLLWNWDNAYNGDVYIYPMIRKGFEDNLILKSVHRIMHVLHWLLYILSLAAPVILFLKWRRKTLAVEQRILLVPALAFIYFLGVLWLIAWLPRYTIPARPLSYILASTSLYLLFDFSGKRWISKNN